MNQSCCTACALGCQQTEHPLEESIIMIRLWPAIPASFALLMSLNSANAAPLRPQLTTGSLSMIEKVHGTHRTCVYSPALGWHRHIRPYNRAAMCGSLYYYEDPFWDLPGITFWFGPSTRYYRDRSYRYHRERPHQSYSAPHRYRRSR
jgi:hypothetical protein